jgi:hypothetical protein
MNRSRTQWAIKRNKFGRWPLGSLSVWRVKQGRTYVGILGNPVRADIDARIVTSGPHSKAGLHGGLPGRWAFQWTWPLYLSPKLPWMSR